MKKTKHLMIGLICAALMVAFESRAALSPLGGEFPLLGDLAGHQKNPNIALAQSSGFVVWQNMPSNGLYEQVMIQRLGPDMTGTGVAVRLGQSSSQGNELNPRVAMLSDGGGVAVWEAGTRANTDVYARFLNSAGSFVSGALRVNIYAGGNQRDSDVAVLSDGNVVVVWSSEGQDGDGTGIYGQLFTSSGARIGGEFQVNNSASMNQSDPAVAAMNGGHFAVAWVSETANGRTGAGAPNLRGNVIGRIFDASGGATGNEYRLNDGDTLASTPVLTTGSDGGFLAAWTQRDEENTRNLNDVYLRSFNSSGVPTGKSVKHNTHLKGSQINPELVQLAGDALVAWTSYGQDTSGAGIQGRLASGGSEFQVNTQGQLHQSSPTVATDGASKFLAVWVNTIQPSHSILSAQRYVTSNSALDGVVDVTAGSVQVVSADSTSRLTGTATSTPPPAPAQASASASDFVESNVQLTSQPAVAAPAPISVAATPPPASAPPAPASPSSRSLASNRMNKLSATSMRVPQRSAASTGLAAMRSMAQSRGRGLPTFGGRATQMTSASGGRRLGGSQSGGRSFPGQSTAQTGTASRRASQLGGRSFPGQSTARTRTASQFGGGRNSLANLRATPGRRTASSMMRGFGSSAARGNPAGRNSSSVSRGNPSSRSNPASSTVRASLNRGSAGGYNLSWQSQRGKRYNVQGSNDLKSWNNVGSARSGRGGTDSVAVGGASSHRYFRVTQAN